MTLFLASRRQHEHLSFVLREHTCCGRRVRAEPRAVELQCVAGGCRTGRGTSFERRAAQLQRVAVRCESDAWLLHQRRATRVQRLARRCNTVGRQAVGTRRAGIHSHARAGDTSGKQINQRGGVVIYNISITNRVGVLWNSSCGGREAAVSQDWGTHYHH